jgi:hypothetical protein
MSESDSDPLSTTPSSRDEVTSRHDEYVVPASAPDHTTPTALSKAHEFVELHDQVQVRWHVCLTYHRT